MDPNECLRLIGATDRRSGHGRRETREHMANLAQWLERGGFAPNWKAHPEGTARFRRAHPRFAPAERAGRVISTTNHRIYKVRWFANGKCIVSSNVSNGLVATFDGAAWDTLGRLPEDIRDAAMRDRPRTK